MKKYKVDKKYIENVEDIVTGAYIVRQQDKNEHIADTGYLSTIMYKIGYSLSPIHELAKISMADGWIKLYETKEEAFVSFKTGNYRYATPEEVLRVVAYQQKYVQPFK
jgi:hypothetical protein